MPLNLHRKLLNSITLLIYLNYTFIPHCINIPYFRQYTSQSFFIRNTSVIAQFTLVHSSSTESYSVKSEILTHPIDRFLFKEFETLLEFCPGVQALILHLNEVTKSSFPVRHSLLLPSSSALINRERVTHHEVPQRAQSLQKLRVLIHLLYICLC